MSDSHEEHMDELLKLEVDDPLKYKEISYERAEWDNIPTIIPRFVLSLSKHLEALTGKCHERFTQISTPDLQVEVDEKLAKMGQALEGVKEESRKERERLEEKIEDLEERIQTLEREHDTKKIKEKEECKTKMQDLIPVPSGQDFIQQFEKDEKAAEEEEKGVDSDPKKSPEEDEEEEVNEFGIILKEKEWFKAKNEHFDDFDKPRSFTLNQIKDLVYLHLSRSDFKKRFVSQNSLLKMHEESLEEIAQYRRQLSEDLKTEFEQCSQEIASNYKDFNNFIAKTEKTQKEMQERIVSNFKKCCMLQELTGEQKGFSDMVNGKAEKLSLKLQTFITQFQERLQKSTDSLENKLRILKETMEAESDSVAVQFDKTKGLCKELIDLNKGEIQNTVSTELENMKDLVEATKGSLEHTMQDVLTKNKAQILKIKDICTKYFNKNDDAMSSMQAKVKVVDTTFEDFMNNVVKPQQLGEARLFAVETRLKEEEDLRIVELSHVKDIIKKLIFAIEQANLTAKDTMSNSNLDSGQPLPNLLKNTTLSSKQRARNEKDSRVNINTLQNRGFDILFIKRLMYLKNSIDDDKHINKEQREMSQENLDSHQPPYPNTMSSALLSLKQGENTDLSAMDNMLSSQDKRSADKRTFKSNFDSSFSPNRLQTADKTFSRREKLKKGSQAKSNSQNRNSGAKKNMNSTFFVTQVNQKDRNRGGRPIVDKVKTTSHRKLNKTELDAVDDSYVDTAQPVLTAIVDKIHKCPKHPGDCNCAETGNQAKGRNNMEEYWKVKRFTIENKNEGLYKSSDNIQHEKLASKHSQGPKKMYGNDAKTEL